MNATVWLRLRQLQIIHKRVRYFMASEIRNTLLTLPRSCGKWAASDGRFTVGQLGGVYTGSFSAFTVNSSSYCCRYEPCIHYNFRKQQLNVGMHNCGRSMIMMV